MVISNDERREVAERLRELDTHRLYDAADEVDALETAIGCCIGQDWQDQDWWERLADLIEPEPERTCQQVMTEHNDGLMPPFTAHCSECDAQWGYTPNYCPNCGAKIKVE